MFTLLFEIAGFDDVRKHEASKLTVTDVNISLLFSSLLPFL